MGHGYRKIQTDQTERGAYDGRATSPSAPSQSARPTWMSDRSQLPREPVSRTVARQRAERGK